MQGGRTLCAGSVPPLSTPLFDPLCPSSVDPRLPSGVCEGQTRRRRISRGGRREKKEEKETKQKKKKQKRKREQMKKEEKNYSGGLSIREPNCVSDTVAFFFPFLPPFFFLRAVPTVSSDWEPRPPSVRRAPQSKHHLDGVQMETAAPA